MGENVIAVVVTAEDGMATQACTVRVTRAEPATATIGLSPLGPVPEGTEITVTMTFGNLELDASANLVFRADVEGADACEGNGIGVNQRMDTVGKEDIPMGRPGRVALYARVSTGDPDFHLQVETQFIILREHARILGADVHREYADVGPGDVELPQLQDMMTEATRPDRPFDAVLVFDKSRLSRSPEEYRDLADRLNRNSVEVVTAM